MKSSVRSVLSAFLFAASVAAQTPTFTGIVNPGSNLPPGTPNFGIAQGAIFDIYGSNLGPATGVFASGAPLPTTAGLGGTTITVTQSSTTLTAPLLYAGAGQVVAVMPSNAPTGANTVTVTYNGKSGSSTVAVVVSAFGISTLTGSGYGGAVVTFGDYKVVSPTNSAKPKDALVMWGTGLGPIAGSDASPAAGGTMNIPLQVFVGGVEATVLYKGRTPGAIGLDQINFTVPDNVPMGCNVGIVVQTNTPAGVPVRVSNAPTIAIAANGGTCTDPVQTTPQEAIPGLISKDNIRVAIVQIEELVADSKSAFVGFLSLSQAQAKAQVLQDNDRASFNTCFSRLYPASLKLSGLGDSTGLNAGTSITLTPPTGSAISLSPVQAGFYAAENLASVPAGSWKVTTPGGPDVPALTFSVPYQQIAFNSAQIAASSPIDRTQPLKVTWTGGDPNSYVRIVAFRDIGPANNPQYTATFVCSAPVAQGSFSIPPSILLTVPSGFGLNVWSWALPGSIGPIPGFDLTLNESDYELPTVTVNYK